MFYGGFDVRVFDEGRGHVGYVVNHERGYGPFPECRFQNGYWTAHRLTGELIVNKHFWGMSAASVRVRREAKK